jgi:tetratricopeptide (TPR) repeat protein
MDPLVENMVLDLEQGISKARDAVNSGNTEEAFSIANELVQQYPAEIRAWLMRAYVQGSMGDDEAAVSDVSNAININQLEPDLFFNRGRYRMCISDINGAVEDFTKGLELCDFHNNDYYRETLLFMRAEALAKLGRTSEALADLAHVRDDFKIYTTHLRSKADIIALRP